MWKRNVALGLAGVLSIITIALCITNLNQQKRLNTLEDVRNLASSEIETQIQRYLSDNAISLVNSAAEDNGVSTEDLIQSAINSVISTSENGSSIYMELSDEQKSEIAKSISDIAYKKLSDQVLSGDTAIDTARMENEIANAVTNVLSDYIDNMEKEYVTAEVNTAQIVNQVIARLNVTTNSSGSALSESEIEELVKKLVNNSSVTSETKDDYQDTITNEVVNYLISNNLISNGSDGVAGKDGLDGEDGKTPVYGVDYMTDEDIATLQQNIETILSTEGLSVYGIEGRGISDATLTDTGDLELILSSDSLLDEENQTITIENVDGNSLRYMDVEEIGSGHFQINYYTEYPLADGDTPLYFCSDCDENSKIKTTNACDEHASNDGDLTPVYKYKAGDIEISETQIKELIAAAEQSILDTIQSELGGSLTDMKTTIDSLQTSVDELKNYVIGGTDDSGNTYAGLGSLTDTNTTTDANGNVKYNEGTLSWVTDQITQNKSDLDGLKETQEKIEAEAGKITSVSDPLKIEVNKLINSGDYYTTTLNCAGLKNKNPGIALYGRNGLSTEVPSLTDSTIWSYCKYYKVNTDDETVTFYFYKNDSNELEKNADLKKLFEDCSIYVALQSYELVNPGTEVNMNQTLVNYGNVRVEGERDGELNLTGPYILEDSNAQINITAID